MTKILDRLPLMSRNQSVSFGERHVAIYRDELLVWVSVGPQGEPSGQLSPPFPALLDTGSNYDFYLNEHHLIHWASIRANLLAVLTAGSQKGGQVSNLWEPTAQDRSRSRLVPFPVCGHTIEVREFADYV